MDTVEIAVALAVGVSAAIGLWLWVSCDWEGGHAGIAATILLLIGLGIAGSVVAPTREEVKRRPTLAEMQAAIRKTQDKIRDVHSLDDIYPLGLSGVMEAYGAGPVIVGLIGGVLGGIAVIRSTAKN
jgi:hypothetical protein